MVLNITHCTFKYMPWSDIDFYFFSDLFVSVIAVVRMVVMNVDIFLACGVWF